MNSTHKKRFYVLLMVLALLIITSISFVFWLGVVTDSIVIGYLLWILLVTVFIFMLMFGIGIFMLVQKIHSGKSIGSFGPLIKGSIKQLYPIIMAICEIFGIDKDKVRGSFIEINNELLLTNLKTQLDPWELLILLPHCIQNHQCKNKITSDINNCTRCGRCDVEGIIDLASKYNIKVAIATGGTLARKIVKENKPKGVLAVACERDLSSGILDCDPLPVIGVLNIRPNGPCVNTGVDLYELEKGIKQFIKEAI